ncbi:methyltransferase domain-containing protein [Thorsellia kenyensis]|uniref:tRNA 5-carboxymethoxyuridine methyltransferase n=1 Tax=Thorsellia kenyensis TaxID=1549888 RepID=A0ABV6CBL6_9GAMM
MQSNDKELSDFSAPSILSASTDYDRNFDDLAHRFCKNIYGTTKGAIRQSIVNEDLSLWYDSDRAQNIIEKKGYLHVVEAGGGDGRNAINWALMGHKVTFCDISHEMIKIAEQKAQEAGVGDKIDFLHLEAQSIGHHLSEKADLLVCHAVLEWIAKPAPFIESLYDILSDDGSMSLMFYNADAAFFRNAIMGNFKALLKGEVKRVEHSLVPLYPLSLSQVEKMLDESGFDIFHKTGVRVFHDYLHFPKQRETEFEALLALERRYCREIPYVQLGRYIHLMAESKKNKSYSKK